MNSDVDNRDWDEEEIDSVLSEHLESVRFALSKEGHTILHESPTDEMLGRYLDNTLDLESRMSLERVMADMPSQLQRLIGIYRECKAVLDLGVGEPVVEKHFLGESVDYDAAKALRRQVLELPGLDVEGVAASEEKHLPRAATENG